MSTATTTDIPFTNLAHVDMQTIISGQFIGCMIMAILAGGTLMQQGHYFRSFPHDSVTMQLFVHLACVISHAQTGMVLYAEYVVFVKYYAGTHVLVRQDALLALQPVMTSTVALIVQCFYARRMWTLQGRPSLILIFFSVVIPLGWGLGLAATIAALVFPNFATWYLVDWNRISQWESNFSPVQISGWSLTLFINFIIFLGTWWTLRGFKHDADERCRTVLCKMIRVLAETMFLPVLVLVLTLVFAVAKGTIVNSTARAFEYCQSKIFIMSLLHLLISRTTLRQRMQVPFTLPSISPLALRRKRRREDNRSTSSISTDSLTTGESKHKSACRADQACTCSMGRMNFQRKELLEVAVPITTWHAPLEWDEKGPVHANDHGLRRHCSLEEVPRQPAPVFTLGRASSTDSHTSLPPSSNPIVTVNTVVDKS